MLISEFHPELNNEYGEAVQLINEYNEYLVNLKVNGKSWGKRPCSPVYPMSDLPLVSPMSHVLLWRGVCLEVATCDSSFYSDMFTQFNSVLFRLSLKT